MVTSPYISGNISGNDDGPAAVGGKSDFASASGNETGTNEGAFAAFGSNNTAIADTNYTINGSDVTATTGNSNFAYVDGPANSTADAQRRPSDIAYVSASIRRRGLARQRGRRWWCLHQRHSRSVVRARQRHC